MKISELIKELASILTAYGDVPCYVEGKQGISPLRKKHVHGGSACIFADFDGIKDDSDPICYIGEL